VGAVDAAALGSFVK